MNTASPTVASGIWLVAEREIVSKLRSKAFIFTTAILFLMALAGVIFGGFAGGNTAEEARPVAATGEATSIMGDVPGLEVTTVDSDDAARELVASGDADVAVIADAASPVGIKLLTKEDPSSSLLLAFSKVPTVEIVNTEAIHPMLRYFVAIGFGLLFFMAAMTFGSMMSQSVVEEKQTRVVEILLSAISTRVLLAGKVLGNTILAMAQIVGLVAIVIIGLSVTGQNALLLGLGSSMIWFAVFFLFGFLLLAALFAAAGALVSRMEDLGSTTTPITMLVMLPYILVIVFNDNPLVLTIMSYVPFSAPVGMPMRLYLGEAQWWEPILSLAILLVSCVVTVLLVAKIYENSILRMGGRVKVSEALRG